MEEKKVEMIEVEKSKLQRLITYFYEACSLCDEMDIYEFEEGDESMQKMKKWVDKEFGKKKVFVSFDYDDDKNYRNLLKAWDANPDFDFYISDLTPGEINTWLTSRIKAALTTAISQATYTLVIIGKNANKKHPKSAEIGYRNWINFEVAKSKEHRNKLVGVKIDREYESPEELLNSGASWAMSLTKDSILRALQEAANK